MRIALALIRNELSTMVELILREKGWQLFAFSDSEQFLAVIESRNKGLCGPDVMLIDCSIAKCDHLDLAGLVGDFCYKEKLYNNSRTCIVIESEGSDVVFFPGIDVCRLSVGSLAKKDDYVEFEKTLSKALS